MAYLQLAENSNGFNRYLAESPEEFYIFVPNDATGESGIWVREDYFDDLPESEWERVMSELADYQPEMMNGIFSRIRENIAERRERRAERKDARQTSRMERIEGRSGGLFGGKLKGFIGSLIPGAGQQMQPGAMDMQPGQTRDLSIQWQDQPQSWAQRNKIPLIIGGVAVAGGIIYLATRKKK